jgi:ATP-dependent DNA helicase RecG
VPQYDAWVMREALHNAIAHQDYAVGGRVNVIEKPDKLIFSNVGRFLPGKVESLLTQDQSPEQYRNPCLTQAMVALKLIDTVGRELRVRFQSSPCRHRPVTFKSRAI